MALANNYQRAMQYQKAQVETARPTQLVVMLYDGAIRFLGVAKEKMVAKDIEARHNYLLKAQKIVVELASSLDMEKGAEIAVSLKDLYIYMFRKLVEANLGDEVEPIDEVISLLQELRNSWAEVDSQIASGGMARAEN